MYSVYLALKMANRHPFFELWRLENSHKSKPKPASYTFSMVALSTFSKHSHKQNFMFCGIFYRLTDGIRQLIKLRLFSLSLLDVTWYVLMHLQYRYLTITFISFMPYLLVHYFCKKVEIVDGALAGINVSHDLHLAAV